ncbi:MAG TPA: methyltransferase domain-containing protein [Candidatus Baltobacteraceae bacterium]|nr:methyltransferase domain-containing protein [Candidatus Baltobacteraceae bacterium]
MQQEPSNTELPWTEDVLATTTNGMGFFSPVAHEINLAFAEFSATCQAPVLDIGSAAGVAALAALRTGARVVANDLETTLLDRLAATLSDGQRERLTIRQGRFPYDLRFADASLGAVHASQVFHFLSGEELMEGITRLRRWLVPGGTVFVLVDSPYKELYKRFIPVFEERKRAGVAWPGEIEDIARYSDHPAVKFIPKQMHVFDPEILGRAFERGGFTLETATFFRRHNYPEALWYDGRESVFLIAKRPHS